MSTLSSGVAAGYSYPFFYPHPLWVGLAASSQCPVSPQVLEHFDYPSSPIVHISNHTPTGTVRFSNLFRLLKVSVPQVVGSDFALSYARGIWLALNASRRLEGDTNTTTSVFCDSVMILAKEIAERINGYLLGENAKDELESWLLTNLRRILESKDTEAIEIANEVDVLLVELGGAIIDPMVFRRKIASLSEGADKVRTGVAELTVSASLDKTVTLSVVIMLEDGLIVALGEQVPVAGFGETKEAALAMLESAFRTYSRVV